MKLKSNLPAVPRNDLGGFVACSKIKFNFPRSDLDGFMAGYIK